MTMKEKENMNSVLKVIKLPSHSEVFVLDQCESIVKMCSHRMNQTKAT